MTKLQLKPDVFTFSIYYVTKIKLLPDVFTSNILFSSYMYT